MSSQDLLETRLRLLRAALLREVHVRDGEKEARTDPAQEDGEEGADILDQRREIIAEVEEECKRLLEQRDRYLSEIHRVGTEINALQSEMKLMALRLKAFQSRSSQVVQDDDSARGSLFHSQITINGMEPWEAVDVLKEAIKCEAKAQELHRKLQSNLDGCSLEIFDNAQRLAEAEENNS